MSESLWSVEVGDLLRRTASSDPTPGGGSVAAVAGAFGLGLVQMAIAVTDDQASGHQGLAEHARRAQELRDEIVPAADGDVADFTALMAAYGLPRTDEEAKDRRRRQIEQATVEATHRPLALVGALVESVQLSLVVEPLVKKTIVSDVLAGRDLLVGAARAAIRTVDINLTALERSSSPAAPDLRARRDQLVAALEGLS